MINLVDLLYNPSYGFNYSVGAFATGVGIFNLTNYDDIRSLALGSACVLLGGTNLLLGRREQIRHKQRQSRNTYLENSYQNGF